MPLRHVCPICGLSMEPCPTQNAGMGRRVGLCTGHVACFQGLPRQQQLTLHSAVCANPPPLPCRGGERALQGGPAPGGGLGPLVSTSDRKPQTAPHAMLPAEEAGVRTRAGLLLEVASVLPVMMGAAFTQNNINSVVRGRAATSSFCAARVRVARARSC